MINSSKCCMENYNKILPYGDTVEHNRKVIRKINKNINQKKDTNIIFTEQIPCNRGSLDECFDKKELDFIIEKDKEHLLSLERTYVANSLKHPLFLNPHICKSM